ncbi:MAG: LptF/LptG family permease [Ignavibacteria bacterium]|nr:LptF/LptG family permease [Ignavibacteria bacterium]
MKVKLIDRYLVKQFLLTTLFGLMAFIVLFIVVDLMENLDDFIDAHVTISIVVKYYLLFIPEIIKLMLPVSMLFASLFTTGKMSNQNEITAIKAGGISLYRFMMPIIVVSFFICGLAVYFGGYVVPAANRNKARLEMTYLKRHYFAAGANLYFQDSQTRIVNIGYFTEENNKAVQVGIQEFDKNDVTKLVWRMNAQSMVYDTVANIWTAYNITERRFNRFNEEVQQIPAKPFRDLQFKPKDLLVKQQKPEQMNLTELRSSIVSQRNAGTDPTYLLIEYYSRFSFAMTGLIVVIFGLPFSADKRRGGMAIQVGVNILITFIYLVMLKVVEAFGKNGALNPLMTAWFVNFLFLIAAVFNLKRVKQ